MNELSSAVKSGHGTGLLYATMIGLVLSDIIPTPGDALYFWRQQVLKKMLADKLITPKEYWVKEAAGYYLYNSAWWALVFGAVILTKGDYSKKLKVGLAMMGGGFVVGVILKNIKKDEAGV